MRAPEPNLTLLELSEKQKDVLIHGGHLLVTGGPGSGKTTISIIKSAKLVRETLRPHQKVLFLSFARATVTRVIEALVEYAQTNPVTRARIDVDTYHAFFWKLLRTHGYLIGLPRRLTILAPPAQAITLSSIRQQFGLLRRLTEDARRELDRQERTELQRLAFEEGKVSFDLFASLASQILAGSSKIRGLISSTYPFIILDEFQDTNADQWRVVQLLGTGSTLIALADEEQRIYDFIGADPERLNQFRERFHPLEIDLGGENYRSSGTDIARFGNDILTGKFSFPYRGVYICEFPANKNQAIAALKGNILQARKRLIASGKKDWSLAILVPTKQLMRQVSVALHEQQAAMPAIDHHAAIDTEGVVLAAEIIAFLLQPRRAGDFLRFIALLCDFFRGRGGDDPSQKDIRESVAIERALQKYITFQQRGKEPPANSIARPIKAGYEQCSVLQRSGDPDRDWRAIRDVLAASPCKRLKRVAEEARNVRLLARGSQLREALARDWRINGSYENALEIVKQVFIEEHFATSARRENGVIVMNLHKAKGKQFDEVIIFEGWPRFVNRRIVSNPHRIVRDNASGIGHTHSKYVLRVGVTRAKTRATIMTPSIDPCVLLPRRL